MDIAAEFAQRGPWVTKFTIDGVDTGGAFDAMNDVRVTQFFDHFTDVKTVLELGSLEGGHSFAIAKGRGVERVVAIEARKANIEKAMFIQSLLGDSRVTFIETNLEKVDLTAMGRFDAVFCSGLLYHLPEPWDLIERLAKITDKIFIWTQYACENEAKKISDGYRGKWYREGGWLDPLSGISKYSFWLSMGSLLKLLTVNGFDKVAIIDNNLNHPNGCSVTLAASRS
ncbi:MAG: class I SAM-dependent methyltransferase [Chloracidobacterium sp.]|nr:class I SAM-dependent methyltransferase [Chloracidobacterium sp.]